MSIPYVIRSFRGGVSDENDKGIAGSFKHGHALDLHDRDDKLVAKQAMATVFDATRGMGPYGGTTITGIINVLLPASDGSTYAFSDQGSIYCRTGEGNWTFVYNDEAGAIKGAGEWEDNVGSNFIYWATSTQISRKPFPGSNSAPDTATMRWSDVTANFKTENVLLSEWHTMKPASGSLFIANREALAEVSFTSSNWDPITLNVRPGNEITSLEERDDYIVMGTQRKDESEEGHIFNWVVTALNWVQKKKIPVKGINALIYTELPLMQGGDSGEIFFSDFNNVVPLNAIPGRGRSYPHAVTIEDDRALFGISGSSISYPGLWSYGRKRKNRSNALSYDYRLSGTVNGSTISTIMAVTNSNGEILASWGTTDGSTSEFGIDQISSTTKANALYEGLEFDAGSPHVLKKFNNVMITMVPLPSGTSISVKYRVNKQETWEYAITGGTSTTFSETNATNAEFIIGDVGYIFEIGIELNISSNSSPEILAITTWIDDIKYEHGGINYPSL